MHFQELQSLPQLCFRPLSRSPFPFSLLSEVTDLVSVILFNPFPLHHINALLSEG